MQNATNLIPALQKPFTQAPHKQRGTGISEKAEYVI